MFNVLKRVICFYFNYNIELNFASQMYKCIYFDFVLQMYKEHLVL